MTVDITSTVWGDTLEDIAQGMRDEYLHPGALVWDATRCGLAHDGERFVASLTEIDDVNGDVRTTTLWSTDAGDRP